MDYSGEEEEYFVDGLIYLKGPWENNGENLRHARKTEKLEDYITIRYHGFEVNAVIKPIGNEEFKVHVTRDGESLTEEEKGRDVILEEGKSYLLIKEPKMYNIINETNRGKNY